MNMQTLTRHYNDKYQTSSVDRRPIRSTCWPRDRYEGAYGILRKKSGAYLEVGAGEGRLADGLAGAFGAMWLVELSESRIMQLLERFDGRSEVNIVRGEIESEQTRLPDEFFDAAAMVAVIEHLVDPICVLRKIHASLRNGGVLVIETPNIAKYSRRLKLLTGHFPSTATREEGLVTYENQPVRLVDEGHMHYFTYRSLRHLCLVHAGFRSVEFKWYGSWAATRAPVLMARLFPSLFSECLIVATK